MHGCRGDSALHVLAEVIERLIEVLRHPLDDASGGSEHTLSARCSRPLRPPLDLDLYQLMLGEPRILEGLQHAIFENCCKSLGHGDLQVSRTNYHIEWEPSLSVFVA